MGRFLATIAFGLIVACAPAAAPAPAGAAPEGGTVKIRIAASWDNLNPYIGAVPSGTTIVTAAYDKLVAVNAKGEIVPYVAKSWKVTPTSMTFTLRNDVKCQDGAMLTAGAVAASFQHLFDPKTPSTRRERTFGAGPWYVTGDDSDGTVTFTLGTPFSDAIYGLALDRAGSIICPAGLKDLKALETQTFGSGPYVFQKTASTPGQEAVLERNPDWRWGPTDVTAKTAGFPQKLVLQIVQNDTTAANLLLTGGLDISDISGADVPRLLQEKSLASFTGSSDVTYTLQMNHRPGRPTADAAVRQAVMMAINQKDWIKAAWNGYGVESTSLLVPGADCFDAETAKVLPEVSMEKAKTVLGGAGYRPGPDGKLQKDGKPLAIQVLGSTTHGNGPDYVQSQLSTLGIASTLRKVEQGTWLESLRSGNFDIATVHTGGTVPTNMVSNFFGSAPPAGSNYSLVTDPVLAKAIPEAFGAVGKERCEKWATVQRAMLQGYHVLPLGAPQAFTFSRGGLTWQPTRSGGVNVATLVRK